ncbi:MAG TPA: 30S ribosomal protein S4 [Candidatus Moranbacteria bacterium]|nr:30S ribosomal protein S4 [Candidatus Moranbacteria bacterium]HAT74538.1 30S ribosomal protein S4 [Candidatus Moranbacteria bacterium]
MARDTQAQCRKCRRAMEKLFLKGDRCNGPKCAMIKRAYIPGAHGKKMSRGNRSEYGTQLSAKQKIKRIYGVMERQFRKHFDDVKNKKGVTGDLLLIRLETRLDNIVYRMGFASSRALARQLVNHGLIAINNKKVSIPSYEVKIGQTVSIKAGKEQKNYFKNLDQVLKNKQDFPCWISFDNQKAEGKIISLPTRDEVGTNVDAQVVVEFYSR